MKVLVFDTETTGLPEDRYASIHETTKWPHIIQLSYILYDTDKQQVDTFADHIIRLASDVHISEESIAIHKITKEISQVQGIPLTQALNAFKAVIARADLLIGHNLLFDKRMLMVEFSRHKIRNFLYRHDQKIPEYCTMKNTVDVCAIPFANQTTEQTYNKYPTLSELHNHLFQTMPKGVHNALVDVLVCLRCYIQHTAGYDILASSADASAEASTSSADADAGTSASIHIPQELYALLL
jgi:DNA polymerase-3 subunit epsilon